MVSAAKPMIGGGVWTAPVGTTAPTDATTALSSAFDSLGYISEDGVNRSTKKDTEVVKAWGGNVVAVLGKGKTETIKFTMLDADNVTGLGLTYGEATGTLANGITVKSTAGQDPVQLYVVDMILADNVRQRLVIPRGVVTEVGDVTYSDGKVEGHEVTITAMEDSAGVTVYEYLKQSAAAQSSGSSGSGSSGSGSSGSGSSGSGSSGSGDSGSGSSSEGGGT